MKYLPKLVKRSTSIDVSAQQPPTDCSPPSSDPWRFFSDIKGKITKSVEDKITEIKTRSQDSENQSPAHRIKTTKDSKENSSLSDSEDLSESSISKTCGIVSTTEGVEMSSDDDTPSLDKDKEKKKLFANSLAAPSNLRQRFRMLKHKSSKEGSISINNLSKLYNINADKKEQTLPEDQIEDVEDGIEVLEDTNLKNDSNKHVTNDEIIARVTEKFDNIEIDKQDDLLNIKQITGKEISNIIDENVHTFFAPTGFVNLRPKTIEYRKNYNFWAITSIFLIIYSIFHYYLPYLAGLMIGIVLTYCCMSFYMKFCVITTNTQTNFQIPIEIKTILEIPAVKEHSPIVKYEVFNGIRICFHCFLTVFLFRVG